MLVCTGAHEQVQADFVGMKITQSAGYNTKCQAHVQAVNGSLISHIFLLC